MIKSVGVCSALGRTSAYTWMKLPVVPEMERVMDSTTFPTLLLGGDPDTSPEETYASWRAALQLPAVRGLVVGRTLLYPADDDVAAAVDTAATVRDRFARLTDHPHSSNGDCGSAHLTHPERTLMISESRSTHEHDHRTRRDAERRTRSVYRSRPTAGWCRTGRAVRRSPATPTAPAEVFDPATGRVTKQVALASRADAEAVIAAAQAAFPAWRDISLARRTQVLFRFRELLNERKHEAAEIITSEHGKVLSDALGEVTRGQEVVEFACGLAHLLKGSLTENASTKVDVSSLRQPLGVVGDHLAVQLPGDGADVVLPDRDRRGQHASILKPSEKDPSTANWLAALWKEAGLPDGVFNVLHGDKVAVDALLEDPRVKAISFVGSTPIARYVYETGTAQRQAGAGAGRGEEPHAGAAGRRPGPGRGRRGQRRLRLGR